MRFGLCSERDFDGVGLRRESRNLSGYGGFSFAGNRAGYVVFSFGNALGNDSDSRAYYLVNAVFVLLVGLSAHNEFNVIGIGPVLVEDKVEFIVNLSTHRLFGKGSVISTGSELGNGFFSSRNLEYGIGITFAVRNSRSRASEPHRGGESYLFVGKIEVSLILVGIYGFAVDYGISEIISVPVLFNAARALFRRGKVRTAGENELTVAAYRQIHRKAHSFAHSELAFEGVYELLVFERSRAVNGNVVFGHSFWKVFPAVENVAVTYFGNNPDDVGAGFYGAFAVNGSVEVVGEFVSFLNAARKNERAKHRKCRKDTQNRNFRSVCLFHNYPPEILFML